MRRIRRGDAAVSQDGGRCSGRPDSSVPRRFDAGPGPPAMHLPGASRLFVQGTIGRFEFLAHARDVFLRPATASSAAVSFCRACRQASALPSRARKISVRSSGRRARLDASAAIACIQIIRRRCLRLKRGDFVEKFAIGRIIGLKARFHSGEFAIAKVAAACFASSRSCKTGFFSASSLARVSF